MKNKKHLIFIFLGLFAFLTQSCEREQYPCKNTICYYNGTCNQGVCDCLPGYEGPDCYDLTASKMKGDFQVISSCDSSTDDLAVGISAEDYAKVVMNNLHATASVAFGNITGETTFNIPEQIIENGDSFELIISGTGTILSDGHFRIDYTVINTGTNEVRSCYIEATRL